MKVKDCRKGMWMLPLILGLWVFPVNASELPPNPEPAASEPSSSGSDLSANPSTSQGTMVLIPGRPALDQYRIITDRNMFQRRTANERQSENRPLPAPRPTNPEAHWILSGTITLGTQQVAFFENTQTHQTLRVALHESMPAGRVVKIERDRVEMDLQGTRRVVEIGQRLDPAAVADGRAGSESGDLVSTPGEEMSLLQRLRARRQQELNR